MLTAWKLITIKTMPVYFIAPYIWHTFKKDFINPCPKNIITCLFSWEDNQILNKTNHMSRLLSHFISHGFLILRRITWFYLDNALTRKKYVPNPKMMWFQCVVFLLPTRAHKVKKWNSASPRNIIRRYCSFALEASVPEASSVILNFCTNNKNSSGLPLSNKSI